jgi:hypothetical protein
VQLTVVQPSAFAARTTDVPREVLWRVVSDEAVLRNNPNSESSAFFHVTVFRL